MAKAPYDPDENELDPMEEDRRPVVVRKNSTWLVWGIMGVVGSVVLYMAYTSEQETKKPTGPEVTVGPERFAPVTQSGKPLQPRAAGGSAAVAANAPASSASAPLPPGVLGLGEPLYTSTGRRIPSPEDREARRLAAAQNMLNPPADGALFVPATASKPIVPASQVVAAAPVPAPALQAAPGAPGAASLPGANTGFNDAEKSRQERLRSKMLVVEGDGRKGVAGLMGASSGDAGNDEAVKLKVTPPTPEPAKQDADFLTKASSRSVKLVQATPPENLTYKILEGKLISAVLETGIDSDLPGGVRAMIDESVYGEHGREILLPRMTRLVGEYDNQIKEGQVRVMVVWRRAIRPDGSSIDLGSYGTDSLGRNGLAGDVDNHFLKKFGNAILISLISGVAKNQPSTFSANNPGSVARQEAGDRLQSMSGSILEREINIPPTIRIDQGSRIKVFVSKDLDFSAVKRAAP